MKAIVLTDKGLGVIEAPNDKNKYSKNWFERAFYAQSLEAAMKQVVFFKEPHKEGTRMVPHGPIIEKGKLYQVPDGYEVKIEEEMRYHISGGHETMVSFQFAILVPKQEFIIRSSNNPKDWVEDFPHENGNYQNKCVECGEMFMGHKRRGICKECFTPNWVELAKKKPPEDNKDNKAWAGAWLEGEMVGYARCMVDNVLPKQEQGTGDDYPVLSYSKGEFEKEKLKSVGIFPKKPTSIEEAADELYATGDFEHHLKLLKRGFIAGAKSQEPTINILLDHLDKVVNGRGCQTDGCPMCDYGKLRNPEKEHWDDCAWNNAKKLLEQFKVKRNEGKNN